MPRFAWGSALPLLLLLLPVTAAASTAYPEGIRAHLDIATAPPCDVCHHAVSEPVGSVDRPFGLAAVARGLVGEEEVSLRAALDALRADGVDSDGDGAQDLDELGWGGDPNSADLPEAPLHEAPTYGCGVAGGEAPVTSVSRSASASALSRYLAIALSRKRAVLAARGRRREPAAPGFGLTARGADGTRPHPFRRGNRSCPRRLTTPKTSGSCSARSGPGRRRRFGPRLRAHLGHAGARRGCPKDL
jgi:hypothetical protein